MRRSRRFLRALSPLIVAVAMSIPLQAAAQGPPAALENVEKLRRTIVTAQVEWSSETPRLSDHPVFRQTARERFLTTLLAGDDVLSIDRGDKEGIISREPDGTPQPYSQSPRQLLRNSDEVWDYQRNSLDASLRPVGATMLPPDLRSLGASPMIDPRGITEVLGFDPGSSVAREYSESREGDLQVISATGPDGVLRWWLDPAKDGNPVRTAWIDEKGTVAETRTTYRKHGDVWFPETVTAYSRDYKEGREPGQIVRIRSVAVNDAAQPRHLGPADLGMEAGVSVGKYDSTGGPPAAFKFDGEKLVSNQEFNERVTAGELKTGPQVDAEMVRLMELPENAAVKRVIGEGEFDPWYVYTTSVIERYALNAEQIQKARLICKECQERRNAFLSARKDVLDAAQNATMQARQADPPDRARIDKADGRLAELLGPVTEIFERQLKPRLDKLPTRAQRAAADVRESARAPKSENPVSKSVEKQP